jgi:hypothetical protein
MDTDVVGIVHIIGSVTLVGVTFILIRSRAMWQWKRRQFLKRVGFSFHYIERETNKLYIRTLFERDLAHVLLGKA